MAIAAEITATTSIKLSDGFTKLAPIAIIIAGYLASFFLLSKVLARGWSLGVVYAVWSAFGIALIALIDAFWFGHRFTPVQIAGLAMITAGVVALELGGVAT
jgi:small multidrug resistance pump